MRSFGQNSARSRLPTDSLLKIILGRAGRRAGGPPAQPESVTVTGTAGHAAGAMRPSLYRCPSIWHHDRHGPGQRLSGPGSPLGRNGPAGEPCHPGRGASVAWDRRLRSRAWSRPSPPGRDGGSCRVTAVMPATSLSGAAGAAAGVTCLCSPRAADANLNRRVPAAAAVRGSYGPVVTTQTESRPDSEPACQ